MFRHLVVPVDGSRASFAAVPVAARMAEVVGGKVEAVTVVDRLADVAAARAMLERGVDGLWPLPQEPERTVLAGHSVGGALKHHLEESQGGMLLMSVHGHNRSAAVLGSTTDEVLRAMFGPVIVIGPRARDFMGRLDGTYVVPLDGSTRADGVLPIVAAWSTTFGAVPCLIEVVDGRDPTATDAEEEWSSISARATELHRRTGRAVESELIHSRHTSAAIVGFAEERDASLIFMATHGRTGFERLRSGSTAASVLHDATCPVILFRPPELAAGDVPERVSAA
jgi:nucleotide-binding universal stress UspA family protein